MTKEIETKSVFSLSDDVSKTAVKMVHEDDSTAVIGGYGVVWDSVDLVGDYFTKESDLEIKRAVGMSYYLDHAEVFDVDGVKIGIDKPVGEVTKAEPDDFGLWFEIQVDKASEYWKYVEAMLSTGRKGFSTGSAPHLVVREEDGFLKRWPLAEISGTLIPAEPKTTLHTMQIKSITNDDEIADRNAEASDSAEGDNEIKSLIESDETEQLETRENNIMEDEVKEEVKAVDNTTSILEAIASVGDTVKSFEDRLKAVELEPVSNGGVAEARKSIAYNRTAPLGSNPASLMAHYFRTGNGESEIKAFQAEQNQSVKANDTIGNVATAADGGNAVPTGHYGNIIAKRSESRLSDMLGLMNIPGVGTTVNVPTDDATLDGFAVTSEQVDAYSNNFPRNMPALGTVPMTLLKYSTKIALTDELLADEDSQLMRFIENYVARDMARQQNALLTTELLANGTSAKTAASATAIAAGEIMDVEYALADEYADNAAWLMRRATEGSVRQLQGDAFLFQSTPAGEGRIASRRTIDNYGVYNAASMPAIATTTKPIVFFNPSFVGVREGDISFLRDPYTTDGIVYLKYYFRVVYKVLQSDAVQYLTMA